MRAVIYARLSAKPDDLDNIPQQLKKGQETAERKGWTVVGEFVDEGRSAWRDDVERPEFKRMLSAARHQEIDVVIVREMARLTRNTPDYGELERARVGIADWSGNVKDALTAAIEVALAKKESTDKSIRGRASEERRVERGQPPRGRRRAYGFHSGACCDDCESHQIKEDEAKIIREAAHRWLGGETLTAIVTDLNTREIPTSGGKRWGIQQLRRTLQSRRIAGIRVHKGREVRGSWSPIIDRAMHDRLTAAERSRHQRRHEFYVLRDLVVCGRCGGTMQGSRHTNVARRYRCAGKCSNGIAADPVDRLVWNAALGRTWHRDRASEKLARQRLAEVKRQRVAAINRRDELDESYWESGTVDRRTYDARYGKLSQRIKDLDAERKQLARQLDEASAFWTSLRRLAEHYETASFDERRAVLRRAIDRVVVEAHGEVSEHYPTDSDGDPVTVPAHFNVQTRRVGIVWR